MCYSQEVSFTVGSLMVSGIAYTWWKFVRHQSDDLQISVYRFILIGYFCVAVHQFADFLSVATRSEMVYKMGLIASISCMFFYMRSLEKLSRLSLGSRVFAGLIAMCAVHILFSHFDFENRHFWVRGDRSAAYVVWSGLWLALYVYWNVCLFYYRRLNPSAINRRLLIAYGMYTINLSYILYSVYAYFSFFINAADATGLMQGGTILSGFDLVQDSPSIWCTFSVIQGFCIPMLFKKMDDHYQWQSPVHVAQMGWQTVGQLIGISFLIWLIILVGFPLFFAAAAKMVVG